MIFDRATSYNSTPHQSSHKPGNLISKIMLYWVYPAHCPRIPDKQEQNVRSDPTVRTRWVLGTAVNAMLTRSDILVSQHYAHLVQLANNIWLQRSDESGCGSANRHEWDIRRNETCQSARCEPQERWCDIYHGWNNATRLRQYFMVWMSPESFQPAGDRGCKPSQASACALMQPTYTRLHSTLPKPH